MSKKVTKKIKKTAHKAAQSTTLFPSLTSKTKTTKPLKTSRTPASKSSTCAYYDCLKGLVALPENDRVKITSLTHKCKCSKKEIAEAKAEMKHKLVHELAKDYRNMGINLGKYVKADIVGCAKELKK